MEHTISNLLKREKKAKTRKTKDKLRAMITEANKRFIEEYRLTLGIAPAKNWSFTKSQFRNTKNRIKMIKFLIKSGITDPDAALGIREILEEINVPYPNMFDDQSFLSPIRIGILKRTLIQDKNRRQYYVRGYYITNIKKAQEWLGLVEELIKR